MLPRIYVVPSPGLVVRHPETHQPIPEVGIEVEETPFWLRRIADRDVVLAQPPAAPTAPVLARRSRE
jgi:hypothetical protein